MICLHFLSVYPRLLKLLARAAHCGNKFWVVVVVRTKRWAVPICFLSITWKVLLSHFTWEWWQNRPEPQKYGFLSLSKWTLPCAFKVMRIKMEQSITPTNWMVIYVNSNIFQVCPIPLDRKTHIGNMRKMKFIDDPKTQSFTVTNSRSQLINSQWKWNPHRFWQSPSHYVGIMMIQSPTSWEKFSIKKSCE